MTTVTVTTAATSTIAVSESRMILRSIDNKYVVNFPIAPREIDYEGFGWEWTEVERDGRAPYLVRESYRLASMTFTARLVRSELVDQSVDDLMIGLQNLASTTVALTMKYGGRYDAKIWRMEDLTFSTLQRHPVSNVPTHVEAEITLRVASDIKLAVGPISGGKKSPAATKKPSTPSKKTSKTRYYKVKKGDTLIKLANRFYGDPDDWRYLAKINKIKNRKIKVGQKIKY